LHEEHSWEEGSKYLAIEDKVDKKSSLWALVQEILERFKATQMLTYSKRIKSWIEIEVEECSFAHLPITHSSQRGPEYPAAQDWLLSMEKSYPPTPCRMRLGF
jgi:hypothetical protein